MLFELLYGRRRSPFGERRLMVERHRIEWERRLDRLTAYLKGLKP
jgi:hypothetical protein